jgi:hypothetical protein
MNDWKGYGTKLSWPKLEYYSYIYLKYRGIPQKTWNNCLLGTDLYPGPPEHEVGLLTTQLMHSF